MLWTAVLSQKPWSMVPTNCLCQVKEHWVLLYSSVVEVLICTAVTSTHDEQWHKQIKWPLPSGPPCLANTHWHRLFVWNQRFDPSPQAFLRKLSGVSRGKAWELRSKRLISIKAWSSRCQWVLTKFLSSRRAWCFLSPSCSSAVCQLFWTWQGREIWLTP